MVGPARPAEGSILNLPVTLYTSHTPSRYGSSREFVTRAWRTAFVLIVFVTSAFAERMVVQVEDGITVEQESEMDRALPIMIGTTTMKTSPEQIAAWVTAVHTYVDWQHNCEEAHLLAQPDGLSPTYNRSASPWPVSDCDVVLRSTRESLEGGAIHFGARRTAISRPGVVSSGCHAWWAPIS